MASLTFTVLALAAWWVLLRPLPLGGATSYVVIKGDSMLPGYTTGDLVVLRAAPSYEVGDIVGYHVPAGELGAGLLVVHRIVGGDATNGFVVQGDNNPAPDPWMPPPASIDGSASVWIPAVGRGIAFLHQPAALAALAVTMLVLWQVGREVARRRPPTEPATTPA